MITAEEARKNVEKAKLDNKIDKILCEIEDEIINRSTLGYKTATISISYNNYIEYIKSNFKPLGFKITSQICKYPGQYNGLKNYTIHW